MRNADTHNPLVNTVRGQPVYASGDYTHDRIAAAVEAGLLMLRRARHHWRCFKHTSGDHDIDLHSGACRFCGTRTIERL
jgi:hypothetical protein